MDSVSDDLLKLVSFPSTARLPCSGKTLFRTILPTVWWSIPMHSTVEVNSTDRWEVWEVLYHPKCPISEGINRALYPGE